MAVYCPQCGAENRDNARFCVQCAASLVQELKCPACGAANPANARFCLNCATPLRGSTPPAGLTGLLSANTVLSGRYVITRRVGKGGMGAVYQATDARIPGKLWAIKEMSDAAILDPAEKQQARDAFQREAQMLALLDHPNLPKVSDFFTESGKLYLVMEFIVGKTLEEVLEASPGPLPEAQVLNWAAQLCDALDYLHSCAPPVIFRDLKPGNIMLDGASRVKLVDFGVARLFKPGQARDTANFGTAGYAPPEQYGKGQTDSRSDIYALGVTLHQLLTRYDPALTPFSLPPARNVNPAVSAHVEQVIIKATQPAQANRYRRATEFKTALLVPAPPQLAKPSVTTPPPPKPTPAVVTSPPLKAAPKPAVAMMPANEMTLRPAPGVEMVLVHVPAGDFLMGSDEQQDKQATANEGPQHRVYLDEYWMGKYSVTVAQFTAFVQATGYVTTAEQAGHGWTWREKEWKTVQGANWQHPHGPNSDVKQKSDHPVTQVSWHDAVSFCRWASQVTDQTVRLPTEAEWEKAARGTDGRSYPWGDEPQPVIRCNCEMAVGDTTPVTGNMRGASPYGCSDMVGNVWEWTGSVFKNYPYQSNDGRDSGGTGTRVLRGGAFDSPSSHVRCSCRNANEPDFRNDHNGFRVCVSAQADSN